MGSKVTTFRPNKKSSRKIFVFFDLKNFENFHSKLYEKWKFWDRKKSKIFRSQKFRKFSFKIVWKWKILRSKKIENLGQKKSEVEEVRESFWYLFFIECLRIKSIRTGNIFPFNFQRDFELNIDSRKIIKRIDFTDTESRKLAWNVSNFVKSHFNQLVWNINKY